MSYKPKKYRIKDQPVIGSAAGQEQQKGDIVYEFIGYDYGLSRDDSIATGTIHTSVTIEADGSGPFFTVPVHNLEEVHD